MSEFDPNNFPDPGAWVGEEGDRFRAKILFFNPGTNEASISHPPRDLGVFDTYEEAKDFAMAEADAFLAPLRNACRQAGITPHVRWYDATSKNGSVVQ